MIQGCFILRILKVRKSWRMPLKLLVDSFLLAETDESITDMFGKDIWPNIQSGIFEALNRLINL